MALHNVHTKGLFTGSATYSVKTDQVDGTTKEKTYKISNVLKGLREISANIEAGKYSDPATGDKSLMKALAVITAVKDVLAQKGGKTGDVSSRSHLAQVNGELEKIQENLAARIDTVKADPNGKEAKALQQIFSKISELRDSATQSTSITISSGTAVTNRYATQVQTTLGVGVQGTSRFNAVQTQATELKRVQQRKTLDSAMQDRFEHELSTSQSKDHPVTITLKDAEAAHFRGLSAEQRVIVVAHFKTVGAEIKFTPSVDGTPEKVTLTAGHDFVNSYGNNMGKFASYQEFGTPKDVLAIKVRLALAKEKGVDLESKFEFRKEERYLPGAKALFEIRTNTAETEDVFNARLTTLLDGLSKELGVKVTCVDLLKVNLKNKDENPALLKARQALGVKDPTGLIPQDAIKFIALFETQEVEVPYLKGKQSLSDTAMLGHLGVQFACDATGIYQNPDTLEVFEFCLTRPVKDGLDAQSESLFSATPTVHKEKATPGGLNENAAVAKLGEKIREEFFEEAAATQAQFRFKEGERADIKGMIDELIKDQDHRQLHKVFVQTTKGATKGDYRLVVDITSPEGKTTFESNFLAKYPDKTDKLELLRIFLQEQMEAYVPTKQDKEVTINSILDGMYSLGLHANITDDRLNQHQVPVSEQFCFMVSPEQKASLDKHAQAGDDATGKAGFVPLNPREFWSDHGSMSMKAVVRMCVDGKMKISDKIVSDCRSVGITLSEEFYRSLPNGENLSRTLFVDSELPIATDALFKAEKSESADKKGEVRAKAKQKLVQSLDFLITEATSSDSQLTEKGVIKMMDSMLELYGAPGFGDTVVSVLAQQSSKISMLPAGPIKTHLENTVITLLGLESKKSPEKQTLQMAYKQNPRVQALTDPNRSPFIVDLVEGEGGGDWSKFTPALTHFEPSGSVFSRKPTMTQLLATYSEAADSDTADSDISEKKTALLILYKTWVDTFSGSKATHERTCFTAFCRAHGLEASTLSDDSPEIQLIQNQIIAQRMLDRAKKFELGAKLAEARLVDPSGTRSKQIIDDFKAELDRKSIALRLDSETSFQDLLKIVTTRANTHQFHPDFANQPVMTDELSAVLQLIMEDNPTMVKPEKVLIIVDSQFSFAWKHGDLYVPDAESVADNINDALVYAKENNVAVIITYDHHSKKDITYSGSRGLTATPENPFPSYKYQSTSEKLEETVSWPNHASEGTLGSMVHRITIPAGMKVIMVPKGKMDTRTAITPQSHSYLNQLFSGREESDVAFLKNPQLLAKLARVGILETIDGKTFVSTEFTQHLDNVDYLKSKLGSRAFTETQFKDLLTYLSIFAGSDQYSGLTSSTGHKAPLEAVLKAIQPKLVVAVAYAKDYCVNNTATDCLPLAQVVSVPEDTTKPIDPTFSFPTEAAELDDIEGGFGFELSVAGKGVQNPPSWTQAFHDAETSST